MAELTASVDGVLTSFCPAGSANDPALAEAVIFLPGQSAADELGKRLVTLQASNLVENGDRTFELHHGGKLGIESRTALSGPDELAMAYTPGVARVCKHIESDAEAAWDLTIKGTTVAVITDGTAVLGLGDIGTLAALPVMEGKAALFKVFGGVNAFPVCLDTRDPDEIVETVARIALVFGGINLEDISAPRCFEIEKRLDGMLDIPVFHDDQHGTAIVALAALENAVCITGRKMESLKIVVSGAGAAGIAVAGILRGRGVGEIILCDSKGIVSIDRNDLNGYKQAFAVSRGGSLADALRGADVFVGVSAPGIVSREMVQSMQPKPIVFGLSNPVPEVMPEVLDGLDAVIATGRSDYPNQINNVLAFPGIFRGALSCRSRSITPAMYRAAAGALAGLVSVRDREAGRIIPAVFDPRVAGAVSAAVVECAVAEGLARRMPE
ncbi:MAG TPA: NADP-dependent malic enzyme [Spirochaetota bacterium]|nr:NADP-dependent malic enzyme [Spirochaetota bacterium]HPN81846.1 NADP-dependent malic enzyme [Spirochaetota bacterium]